MLQKRKAQAQKIYDLEVKIWPCSLLCILERDFSPRGLACSIPSANSTLGQSLFRIYTVWFAIEFVPLWQKRP